MKMTSEARTAAGMSVVTVRAAGVQVQLHQRLETRVVGGGFACGETGDLVLDDIVAGLSQASAGDEAYVSGSDDCYVHEGPDQERIT